MMLGEQTCRRAGAMVQRTLKRPGISNETLKRHGIREVESSEANQYVGSAASGLLIPYFDLNGTEVTDNGKPYSRLRLKTPKGKQKYHQEAGSGVHAYLPAALSEINPSIAGPSLCVIEGEFKAISLCESGFPAVGISGFYGFQDKANGLVPELWDAISRLEPRVIYFCGDSDTTLNWQFSDAAVKLKAYLPDTVLMLPRIPLIGHGKGSDDCKEALGESFDNWWYERQRQAVEVTDKIDSRSLSYELLHNESANLSKYLATHGHQAERALIGFLANLGSGIAYKKTLDLISKYTNLSASSLKAEVKELLNSGEESRSPSHAVEKKIPELYYYEGIYYRQNTQKTFSSIPARDAERELKYHGFGNNKVHNEASEIDIALRTIQLENCVQGAGPLCGRMPGVVSENGFKFLVTRGPNVAGACSQGSEEAAMPFFELLNAVFGHGENPHFEIQLLTFMAWLKRARLALRKPKEHLPGQMLVLVGPAGCGKSYLQLLITHMLGGRECDPYLWLQGKTPFNGNLWEAEHLVMSDSNLEPSGKGKTAMRDKIKEVVANPSYPMHNKGKEQLTLRPIWRLSLSANDDITSANILPALEKSTEDKIIYFKCYNKEGFFPPEEKRQEHHNSILNSIPAFLHFVENMAIPEEMSSNRWGVAAWHHPKCLELLQSYNPEMELEEILDKWLTEKTHGIFRKRPRELYGELETLTGGSLGRCSTSTNHLGHQLARLMERKPWKGIITKTTEREGPSRSERVYYSFDCTAYHGIESTNDTNELL